MGVGGLLKDVTARPLPRARATAGAAPHGVAAVVLAAGQSSRMAPRHKLLVQDATGRAMVARVVDGVLASRARPVLVVTGHRADEVKAALAGRPVTFVTAPDYAEGLSASLRAGLAAVPASTAAALVVLGDMPLVTAATIDRLIDSYDPDEGRTIVAPSHNGELGNPVLWDRRHFPAMMALTGDRGARALLRQHAEAVAEIAVDDTVLRDFDTADSLLDLPG
jgi:molybdenum cofactor cytidylyltransferase